MSLQIPMQLETPPRAKKRKLSSESASKWTDHQIEMLIAMWKEPDVLEAIRQPKPVYVLLANRLNDVWGNIECPDRHIWDADMIKNKIKNLRQQYIEIVEELSKQPEIHEQQDREENMAILSSWPYFGDLHDIITILPSKPKPQASQSPSRSGGEDEDTAVFPVSLVTAPSISDANLMTNQPEDMVHHVKLEKVNDRQPVRKLGNQNYQDDEDEHEEEEEEEEGGLSKSQGQSHGRAPAWTDEEIRMLVEIWQEPEIANAIAIPTTRYKEVYQEVTDRINRIYKTHYRESIQVKHRIKYMKMTHKKLSDRAKQDPSFDPTREMLCYDEIGEIVSRKVSLPAPKEPEVKDKERPVVKKASSKVLSGTRCSKEIRRKRGSGRTCAVKGCSNNHRKLKKWKETVCTEHGPLTQEECPCLQPYGLHRFPGRPEDAEKKRQWVINLNLTSFNPMAQNVVCGIHFPEGRPTDKHPYPVLHLENEAPKELSSGRAPPKKWCPVQTKDSATSSAIRVKFSPTSDHTYTLA